MPTVRRQHAAGLLGNVPDSDAAATPNEAQRQLEHTPRLWIPEYTTGQGCLGSRIIQPGWLFRKLAAYLANSRVIRIP
jgi:hypothetical protein